MLRRGPVPLDEIGRRLGHARGYMSRVLRGATPLRFETIVRALKVAGISPAEYFAALATALTPPEPDDDAVSQARVEETVLRTLRHSSCCGFLLVEILLETGEGCSDLLGLAEVRDGVVEGIAVTQA